MVRNDFIAAYFEGGEPLVRPGFMRVLQRASRSMMTWLRTHATLIDASVARNLKEAGLGGAFVEVMGANPLTHVSSTGVPGSFEATCRGIAHLVNVGIETRIVVILTRRTAPELNDVLALARDLGVEQVSVLRLYPIGRAKRLWGELALSLDEQTAALNALRPPPGVRVAHSWHPHDKNCCWSSIAVNAHGDSIGCPYLREFVNYGNVLEVPLLDSWRQDPLYRFLRSGEVSGGCDECETREGTRGGCRSTAFAFSGRWDAPDPFCSELNGGVDLRALPDRQIDLAGMRVPRLPDQAVGQPAQSDGPIGRSRQQRDARPGSYRLVEGTRMRELPDRDLCMVYTPRAPALYALQDEAWLILRECLGKTRDEVMDSYASLVAAAGVDSDDAALDVLEGLGDLESKGIIEEVPLLPHLDISRRETLHRRTHV